MKLARRGMASPKFCKFFMPLSLVGLLFFYLSIRLPDDHLRECSMNGGPCLWHHRSVESITNDIDAINGGTQSLEHITTEFSKHCSGQDFQISRVLVSFNSAVTKEEEVLLEQYLVGWDELIKFMEALGTVFSFISQEVKGKIGILRELQSTARGNEYYSVRSMMDHELRHNLVNFHKQTNSGCRTLLRLHRALKWLELFLHKLGMSSDESNTSDLCQEAYNEALAPYHSWLVRQAASMAFLALPERKVFFDIVCIEHEGEAQLVLERTVRSIVRVYNIMQEAYHSRGMLNLP
ncbi:ceramide-1-phosphate transfer protein-like isoform X1 [Erpetoichthys calabaricus]|uniref:ceramide-1-phosphate transfer protein-like isoform X1 n=1 Tax=Erpetoichthys calabaricus TaxID=27687 RepID=UPI00109FFCE8|nr:ceramide-1-phosphate transfer protein-like isoform X1 [Erpetoichthys calabaricus]